ncbi:hypothetical protein FACS189454_02630 [Planctomycetales bacterium]|nr:hypothetical protein FACS189454_02630 [Planctomycetales bacterium]
MALPSPEQLDAMATQIANCGADLQVIRGKIQAAVQGASGQQIPGVMEDVNQISSSVSAAQEKANAAAAKLRAKAQAVRQAYGGG